MYRRSIFWKRMDVALPKVYRSCFIGSWDWGPPFPLSLLSQICWGRFWNEPLQRYLHGISHITCLTIIVNLHLGECFNYDNKKKLTIGQLLMCMHAFKNFSLVSYFSYNYGSVCSFFLIGQEMWLKVVFLSYVTTYHSNPEICFFFWTWKGLNRKESSWDFWVTDII